MAVLSEYLILFLYYVLITIIVILFVVYIYFTYTYQYWKKRGVEYLKPTLFFGNIYKCFDGKTHLDKVFKELHDQIKGPFAGVFFVHKPAIIIKDPELLKHILVKDFSSFMDRGVHSDGESDPLSLHLFRLSGSNWKSLRSKLSPAFSSGKLKIMFPTVMKTAEDLQNALGKFAESGQLIDAKDICSRYTIDVINTTAFGVETNSFSDPMNKMCSYIQNLTKNSDSYSYILKLNLSMTCPELLVLLKQSSHSETAINFMFDVVKSVVDYRFSKKVSRNDFLQLLIQLRTTGDISDDNFGNNVEMYDKKVNNQILTFEEMVAQAYVFIIAGFDTSAVTMSYCLYELARNPDIQKRVQKDIDNVLSKHSGLFSYESVFEMEYLAATVAETLRKYPPLGYLNRIATENYKIPNTDVIIEKNMKVVVSVHGLHADPEYYPNPEKFDPDRFLPKNKDQIKPFTYLPFGDGPRHCIGARLGKLQTMTGLAMMLTKYNFEVCPETPTKLNLQTGNLISVTSDVIKLLITRRE